MGTGFGRALARFGKSKGGKAIQNALISRATGAIAGTARRGGRVKRRMARKSSRRY